MNLFRQDVGGTYDTYNQYVLPAQQAQSQSNQAARQNQAELNQLRSTVGKLNGELEQVRDSGAAPTGAGSQFMQHGQYFQTNVGATRATIGGGGRGRSR